MSVRRVELGFEGGTVLRTNVAEDVLQTLTGSLTVDGAGWVELNTDDGVCWVDLGEVIYLRIPKEPRGVGFSGA